MNTPLVKPVFYSPRTSVNRRSKILRSDLPDLERMETSNLAQSLIWIFSKIGKDGPVAPKIFQNYFCQLYALTWVQPDVSPCQGSPVPNGHLIGSALLGRIKK